MWTLFSDYQKLAEFANNIAVTNDLAERVKYKLTHTLYNNICVGDLSYQRVYQQG